MTEAPLFPHKTAYFLNDWHDSYKNADGNSKYHITKLFPSEKLTLEKQSIKSKVEVKVSVNLANKYKVKSKNFIISVFYFSIFFLSH